MPKVSGSARLLRLWDLLVYLDKSAYTPVEKLAAEFGVSVKQINEDLELLAGIETPDNIGFYLVDLDLDALEDEGLVKLSLQAPARIPVQIADDDVIPLIAGLKAIISSEFAQSDQGRAEVARHALEKLSKISGNKSEALDIKLPQAPNVEVAKQVTAAIANGQQLQIEYVNSDDILTTRIVDPAVVVTQNRYVYLRAWCHNRNKERAFRIDRILRATPGEKACPEHLATLSKNADVAAEAAT
ncbi:MAG: WYL domain-containing protein, partial [Cellulomonadaceae bacterium]|nr:WYL domain-containing protein [Cellulomonadaceae bacterium]